MSAKQIWLNLERKRIEQADFIRWEDFLVSRDSRWGSVFFSLTNVLLWASTQRERHMSFDILTSLIKIKKNSKENKQAKKKTEQKPN